MIGTEFAILAAAVGFVYAVRNVFCGEQREELSEDEKMAKHHLSLTSSQLKSTILIIGDVHGCLNELNDLLVSVKYNSEHMTVIMVGDLVNKGPLSSETVKFVYENGFYCVLGNHDLSAIKELKAWRSNQPIREKYSYVSRLSKEEGDWLLSLPFTITLPDHNAIVVHAGLIPNIPLPQQTEFTMTKMRNIKKDKAGVLEGEEHGDGEHWVKLWTSGPHVYYGHDAKRRLQLHDRATGLDTGSVYGGNLTGILLPSRQLVSVPAREVYEDKSKEKKEKRK
jgi:hypothetical protein